MHSLGFQFESDGEDRLSFIYNAILALILSQLPNLGSLVLDCAGFPTLSQPECTPANLSWARLVSHLQLRHLDILDLEAWHKPQSLGLIQSLSTVSTLETFKAVNFAPSLPVSTAPIFLSLWTYLARPRGLLIWKDASLKIYFGRVSVSKELL